MKYKLKYEYKNKYREKLMLLAKKRHIDVLDFFGSVIRGVWVKRLFRTDVRKCNVWSCDANVCQAFVVRCTKKFMKWP